MGAQGASQQTSSCHARLRYSMKLSRQSISFHLKLCANASAGTKECAESPTPVIEENHTSQVLVDIASTGAEVTNFRSIQYYTKTTIAR